MLRFLSSAASAGEMFSAVNVDARTEAGPGQGRAGRTSKYKSRLNKHLE